MKTGILMGVLLMCGLTTTSVIAQTSTDNVAKSHGSVSQLSAADRQFVKKAAGGRTS